MFAIDDACNEPDMTRCNHRITRLHFELSEALENAMGREGGPNFHSWAVWGSRKAGVTIRQEDLGSAIVNATWTAGIVGALIGGAVGVLAGRLLHWSPDVMTAAIGIFFGSVTGALTGRRLAIWSRAKAARLILSGNQIVLRDIGEQSAKFLELLESGASTERRELFFSEMRPGSTEEHGQDRLAGAFRSYLKAFDSADMEEKREATIKGNCAIVYHEHIRLEPYIRDAMPWIIQRCATQRLMTYEVGNKVFNVGEDLPGVATSTAAKNWTKIEERMRYVFALFRKFHDAPEVFFAPDSENEPVPFSEYVHARTRELKTPHR